MTKSRTLRKAGAVVLSLAMAASTLFIAPDASAAAKVKLSSKKGTITVGKTKKVTIKGTKKANIKKVKFTYSKSGIVKATRSGLTIKVKGKKKGTSTVTAKITLKKAVAKKKTYSLKYKATVKKATPAPTATPVIPATAIQLDKVTAEVVEKQTVTLTASLTPADSNQEIEWTSDKPEIATVTAGVVTGVKAGEATITAKVGEFTATCKVTVKAAEATAKLTAVKQDSANTVTLTFDADASKIVTKSDIAFIASSDKFNMPVTALVFSEDGLTAKATVSGTFKDKEEYTVKNATTGAGEVVFTASVGEVASIAILTKTAEKNTDTTIVYTLNDANGMDVTASQSPKTQCMVTFDGTYVAADPSDPTKPTIKMGNENDTATVTVTYNSNKDGAQDIKATETITCVPATAKLGEAVFYSGTAVNANSGCAKFYNNLSDSGVKVTVDKRNDDVYLYAKDKDGSAISYDSYEGTSSDEDLFSVSTTKDSGKYAKFSITGIKVGAGQINVKAVKNDVPVFYAIPVTVTKVGKLDTVSFKASKPQISNAYDTNYSGTITAEAKDADGNKLTTGVSFSYELTTENPAIQALTSAPSGYPSSVGAGFGFTVNGAAYTAYCAKADSYTIKCTASDDEGKVITRSIGVSVKELPEAAWVATGNGSDMSYGVEVDHSTLDIASGDTATARLTATTGGIFAGYVDEHGNIGTDFSSNYRHASTKTELQAVTSGVKFGTKYSTNGDLFNSAANVSAPAATAPASTINIHTVSNTAAACTGNSFAPGKKFYVKGEAAKYDGVFAKTGSYTVEFNIDYTAATEADAKKTQSLTVKSSFAIPTVSVNSRSPKSQNVADVIKCLSANVDLNNNDGTSASIVQGIYSAIDAAQNDGTTTNATFDAKGKCTVKYVGVIEDGVCFFIPINATFTKA